MTINIAQHPDGDYMVYVDADGETLGICVGRTTVNTDAIVDLLQAVIAKCGSEPADVIHHGA